MLKYINNQIFLRNSIANMAYFAYLCIRKRVTAEAKLDTNGLLPIK